METRAVTELGYTAPSLLGLGVLGLKVPAGGNAIRLQLSPFRFWPTSKESSNRNQWINKMPNKT